MEVYSDITDDELYDIYRSTTGNSSSGPITPNIGRRRFIGALRSRCFNIQSGELVSVYGVLIRLKLPYDGE